MVMQQQQLLQQQMQQRQNMPLVEKVRLLYYLY
jgi:hypothetical protein